MPDRMWGRKRRIWWQRNEIKLIRRAPRKGGLQMAFHAVCSPLPVSGEMVSPIP